MRDQRQPVEQLQRHPPPRRPGRADHHADEHGDDDRRRRRRVPAPGVPTRAGADRRRRRRRGRAVPAAIERVSQPAGTSGLLDGVGDLLDVVDDARAPARGDVVVHREHVAVGDGGDLGPSPARAATVSRLSPQHFVSARKIRSGSAGDDRTRRSAAGSRRCRPRPRRRCCAARTARTPAPMNVVESALKHVGSSSWYTVSGASRRRHRAGDRRRCRSASGRPARRPRRRGRSTAPSCSIWA